MSRDFEYRDGLPDEPFGRRGLDEGENRRYWRRRANRRVRKARITRNVVRWSLIVTLQLAFVALLIVSGHRAWVKISASDEFSLKRIELAGTQRVRGEAITQALEPYLGGALLDLDLAEIERAVQGDPWVLGATLKRVLPDTLRIEITERTPCAVAVIGGLAHVVDREGFVIGPTGLQHAGDLPVLTGLTAAARDLPAALRRGVGMLERLRRTVPGFVDEISEMDVSRRDRVTLRTVASGPLILLDPDRVERNLPRFLAVRSVMGERLDDAAVVDLRWQDRVSVTPQAPRPENEGQGTGMDPSEAPG